MYLRNQVSLWREEEHEKELKKSRKQLAARKPTTPWRSACSRTRPKTGISYI